MTALFKFCIIALVAFITGLGIYGLTAPSHAPARQFVTTDAGVRQTVLSVLPGSGAAKAGLRAGDVIDNADVSPAQFFARHFSRTGQRISLTILRSNTRRSISFSESVTPRPNPPDQTWLGFAVVLFGLATSLLVALRQSDRREARLVSLFLIAISAGTVLDWTRAVAVTPAATCVGYSSKA